MTNHGDPLWNPRPLPRQGEGVPPQVQIFEVGPRDGLQAETRPLPTQVKRELCEMLWQAGTQSLEVTSFVPPQWVPQLADAAELTDSLSFPENTRNIALVPNVRGLERAQQAGYTAVSAVASCSESFARANLNATVGDTFERVAQIVETASPAGIPVRGYLSMAFGDPWEGHTDPHRAGEYAAELHRLGCSTVAISDTIGTATPQHTKDVLSAAAAAGLPMEATALHMHDTYGLALTNVYAALEAGAAEFDSSVGGLGRCPYAPGAAGNLATEDLVWMLEGLGVETGLDMDLLVETSSWISTHLGKRSPSRVVRALSSRRSQRLTATGTEIT